MAEQIEKKVVDLLVDNAENDAADAVVQAAAGIAEKAVEGIVDAVKGPIEEAVEAPVAGEEKEAESKDEAKDEAKDETKTEAAAETKEEPKEAETAAPAKTEPKEPVTEAEAPILKQVEFYFSDQNLPTDKFLWKAVHSNDGWVPIHTIASFKRMQQFANPDAEDPLALIVSALRKSPSLLEVSEDGTKVKRVKALQAPDDKSKDEANARTVYAKGFLPEDKVPTKDTPASELGAPLTREEELALQIEIEGFFEGHGKIVQVRLRRRTEQQNRFKGSVFAEFEKLEDATKFLALEPKPTFQGRELKTMSKPAYCEMKKAELGFTDGANGKRGPRKFNGFKDNESRKRNNDDDDNGDNKRQRGNPRRGRGGRGRGRGGRGRGGRD
ncbi:La protein-like protein [Yarrowia sp. C11]|nr:La protein-like protein [Yarrowia sp. C11]KAG5370764.1 La protein-like protein [Yarrowia sp. E02]